MIKIKEHLLGAVVACFAGVGIAALNYAVARFVLKKYPERYAMTSLIRQLTQIGYLVLILLLGDVTPWDKTWLLVGGALGVTLPMPWFTYRLVKFNDAKRREGDENG